MYSRTEAQTLSDRYWYSGIAAIRSRRFTEDSKDKGFVMGMFATFRRAIHLKCVVRSKLLDTLHAIPRVQGAWDEAKQATWSTIHQQVAMIDESLTHSGGIMIILGGMLDGVTTPAERIEFLKLDNAHRPPQNATTLQAVLSCCAASSWASSVHRYVEYVAQHQGLRKQAEEFAADLIDAQIVGKLQGAPWVEHKWRHATINVVCRIRREIRKLHETRKSLTVDKRLIARKMRKLEKEGAHGAARELAILGMQVEGCQQQIQSISAEIRTHADRLICVLERLDLTCSLEDRLDLFNVNPVDRARVSDEQDSRRLLCVESLEDSAEHRAAGHIYDHPLARALMEKCVDALYESQAGREVLAENISECYFDGAPVIFGPDEQAEATPRVLH